MSPDQESSTDEFDNVKNAYENMKNLSIKYFYKQLP